MFRKLLLGIILIVSLIGIMGCAPKPELESAPLPAFINRDLIVIEPEINIRAYQSCYIFFLENHSAMHAYAREITIRFDSSLDKPIIRAEGLGTQDTGLMRNVEVTFRDKKQMAEYWENIP